MSPQAVFTLDLDRCTGCSACVVACHNENDVSEGLAWREVTSYNSERVPGVGVHHLSIACNHCAEPACLAGCPADAYRKDPTTGAVLLEPDHCIGCRYCSWVCPYDAPRFAEDRGVMEKCTFCQPRLVEGLDPACVVACPVDALGFEREGEPGPIEMPGVPEIGILPGLRLTGRRRGIAALPGSGAPAATAPPSRGLSLRSEWPLLVLTFVASLLVPWLAARPPEPRSLPAFLFLALGAVALAVGPLHLGRPERAWRAILNLRRSWLSREIALVSAFFGLAFLRLLLGWSAPTLTALSLAAGFAALFAIDKVYDIPGPEVGAFPHSAMTILTATYLFSLLLPAPWLALAAGALHLALYLLPRIPRRIPALERTFRIGAGFVWPAVLLALGRTEPLLLLAGPVLAALVDRVRFYRELRFPTPARQAELDLAAELAGRRSPATREVSASRALA